jgi:hypothetical protein
MPRAPMLLGHVLLTWEISFESLAGLVPAWTLRPVALRWPSAFLDLGLAQKEVIRGSFFAEETAM